MRGSCHRGRAAMAEHPFGRGPHTPIHSERQI